MRLSLSFSLVLVLGLFRSDNTDRGYGLQVEYREGDYEIEVRYAN